MRIAPSDSAHRRSIRSDPLSTSTIRSTRSGMGDLLALNGSPLRPICPPDASNRDASRGTQRSGPHLALRPPFQRRPARRLRPIAFGAPSGCRHGSGIRSFPDQIRQRLVSGRPMTTEPTFPPGASIIQTWNFFPQSSEKRDHLRLDLGHSPARIERPVPQSGSSDPRGAWFVAKSIRMTDFG